MRLPGPFAYIHAKASTHDQFYVFDTRTGAIFPFMYILVTFIFTIFVPFMHGWPAVLIVIPGIALVAGYTGVEVNLADMQYRDYRQLFHWRSGVFKPIETPKFLLLSSDSIGTRVRYQLHLITEGKRDLVLFVTMQEHEQLSAAHEVAKRKGWKIYDNTIDGLIEVTP